MKLHFHQQLVHHAVLINSTAACMYYAKKRFKKVKKKVPSSRTGCPTRPCTRKSVKAVFNELGRKAFRRAYRMHLESFYDLYKKIKKQLWIECKYDTERKYAPNGRIHPTVRLACALRMFAGGETVDIACTYGLSKTEVHDSFDYVIAAVNSHPDLKIEFPSSHEEQHKIAEGFHKKSKADIKSCVGCIDGMLVWMFQPTKAECKRAGVDSGKFFCGRKHKFGVNFQAVCDSKKRFLNISILFPASCSDFIAFEATPFRAMLEQPGFLARGLCLFGDNAYVNRFYMATPYSNVGENTQKDIYNFFHSQLRINIECAFGILVARWGILRKALSSNFTVAKIVSMVECLCRLHNFIIDMETEPDTPAEASVQDNLNMILDGAISVDNRVIQRGDGTDTVAYSTPSDVMHGGEHFDDVDFVTRNRTIACRAPNETLPRELIFAHVSEQDLRRPKARSY